MTWIKLTSSQAHLRYRVPLKLAVDEANSFYGTERQPESSSFDDGPWSFLAFLRNREKKDIVTFHIDRIHFEALELEDFNPLLDQSNYLSLSKRELSDLVDLLQTHAETIPSSSDELPEMFRQLMVSELVDFHLHPKWLPDQAMHYYLQARKPQADNLEAPMATIVVIGTGDREPASRLFLQIADFPLHALQDSSFNPLDYSVGRIRLDKKGMEELAHLLQAQLDNLVYTRI